MAKDVQLAYAVTGPVLAIGDTSSVKAAIDTGGKTGLNTNEQFKTASATITGDRLAFAYVDTEAIVTAASAMVPADNGMPTAALSVLDGLYPDWSVVAVEAKDGALVVESRQPHNEKLGTAPNAASTLPSLVPADTVVLVDTQDFGGALKRLKALLASDASLKDGVQQVDDALKLVGGFDAAVGWMGESGIAITNTNGEVARRDRHRPDERRRRQSAVHPAARVHRARGRRIRASSSPTRRTTGRRSPRSTCPASAPSPGPRPGSTFPAGCSSRTP